MTLNQIKTKDFSTDKGATEGPGGSGPSPYHSGELSIFGEQECPSDSDSPEGRPSVIRRPTVGDFCTHSQSLHDPCPS